MCEDVGFNTNGMRIYLQLLDSYEKKLQNIRNNPLMMQENGWQREAFGTTFKHLLSNAGDFQKQIDGFIQKQNTLETNQQSATNVYTVSAIDSSEDDVDVLTVDAVTGITEGAVLAECKTTTTGTGQDAVTTNLLKVIPNGLTYCEYLPSFCFHVRV